MTAEKIKELVAQMTLEEKAAMCSGADFWHTEAVERLGIPASMVSDGPHGLRKQNEEGDHLGINDSIKAVCFPAGCGTAASFNRELLTQMGETLGNECQAEGVSVILGPAVNIKRSPLCGRNFEYYSEDPLVASEMAGALIHGIQSKNVGTSIKHFLANNQETRRMSSDSRVDERTLHEIYLAAFEGAVKKEKPWTVMCSYNKINGTYAAQNHQYLTETLRDQWGFDGYVMSDWGAVNNRVEDLKAGLDLEMPGSNGAYAKKPRYQGGGSSHINSHKITSALDAAAEMKNVTYAQGFEDVEDKTDEKLLAEAVEAARNADVAVIFAGLPDKFESEGFDRKHMAMPDCQNELIEKVAAVQPNTVVVLHNGSPVEMPWIGQVKGIVEAYLGGQAVGGAVCDILFGKVNPSAKLPETFPLRLEDNPSYLSYIGEGDMVEYREGIFVGYRYYDKKKMDVLFPFGYGLSYTTFAYSNLTVDKEQMKDTDTLRVTVDVTNTGDVAGKEVVQLYVADRESTAIRPVKELRDFAKVELAPGETKTVTFTLDQRAFAYYSVRIHDWHVETGAFDIMIGKSSRDIVLTKTVTVESTVKLPFVYTTDTTLGDIRKDPGAWELVNELFKGGFFSDQPEGGESEAAGEAISDEMNNAMIEYLPLRGPISFTGKVTMADVQALVDKLNALEE